MSADFDMMTISKSKYASLSERERQITRELFDESAHRTFDKWDGELGLTTPVVVKQRQPTPEQIAESLGVESVEIVGAEMSHKHDWHFLAFCAVMLSLTVFGVGVELDWWMK